MWHLWASSFYFITWFPKVRAYLKTRIESLNDKDLIYDGYRSNSTSLTIEDIYEKLDMLGQKFELVNSRLANMDEAIAGLEEKVEDLWVSCFPTIRFFII